MGYYPVVVTRGFTFYGGLSPPFFVSAVPFFDVRSSLNLAPSRGWCGRSEAKSRPPERHTCKYLVCMGMQTVGRHPHTDKLLLFALAGTKEQGEAPSGRV